MSAPAVDLKDRAPNGAPIDLPNAANLVHAPKRAERDTPRDDAPEPPPIGGMRFTREQIDLIKRTVAKGTSDDELQLFIMQCERTGLDPFARQIYCVKRWDAQLQREVAQTQISIDGARLIAERTRKYAGQLPVQWAKVYGFDVTGGDPVIRWFDVWPFVTEAPYAAKARILRTDFAEPMEAVARFDAYKQTKKSGEVTHMWAKMPDVMLAKVAEMLGLRKAFPHELRGLYSTDEMAQAENERPSADNAAAEPPFAYGDDLSIDQALSTPLIGDASNWAGHGGKPLGEVPPRQLQRALAWVEQKLRARHDDRLAVQAEALTLVLAEYERREAATPHADGAVPPAGRVSDALDLSEPTPKRRTNPMDAELEA